MGLKASGPGPEGSVPVQVVDGLARVQNTDAVGIYEAGGGLNERVAADLFSPNESKIEPTRLVLGTQRTDTQVLGSLADMNCGAGCCLASSSY